MSIPRCKKLNLNNLLKDEQNISDSFLDYYVLPKVTTDGAAFSLNEDNSEISADTSPKLCRAQANCGVA